jgi:hypothetical protein
MPQLAHPLPVLLPAPRRRNGILKRDITIELLTGRFPSDQRFGQNAIDASEQGTPDPERENVRDRYREGDGEITVRSHGRTADEEQSPTHLRRSSALAYRFDLILLKRNARSNGLVMIARPLPVSGEAKSSGGVARGQDVC